MNQALLLNVSSKPKMRFLKISEETIESVIGRLEIFGLVSAKASFSVEIVIVVRFVRSARATLPYTVAGIGYKID